jgi:hypothetical protein
LACGLLLAFAGMTTAATGAVGSSSTGRSSTSTAATTTSTDTTTVMSAAAGTKTRAVARQIAYWSRHIRHSRAGTRRWQTVVLGRPPLDRSRSLAAHSVARLRQIALKWRYREHAAWWRANHPPALQGWLCIHHYEGSWTDSSGPYWGGLQMDLSFQARYGGWLLRHKGTANHWSPLEQIWVAVRASHTRGFSPWPNTAQYCGMA